MSLIGEMLVKSGIIDQKRLDEALDRQEKEHKRLGEILIDLGYISAKELIWILSEQADMPFVELKPEMLDSALINRFPEKILCENNLLPLYQTVDRIYVALGDPTDTVAIKKMETYTTKEVVVSGAEVDVITQLLEKSFLAQSIESMLAKENSDGTNLKVLDNRAIMEFTDESGNIIRKNVMVNFEVRIRENGGGQP
jgi:type IV pilus assembly protein PilB